MHPPLLLPLLLLLLVAAGSVAGNHLRFELLRRGPDEGTSRVDHLRHLARSDHARQGMMARVRGRRACEGNATSFEMPIGSGAYVGTGQYFVRFRVGTPAQRFLLVADTGSDLTWMNCRYRRRRNETAVEGRRVFRPEGSTSFKAINCSSVICVKELPFSLTTCPSPASPCAFDYGYSDGSTAQGFYANEWATVDLPGGRRTKLRGLVIGCTSAFTGSSFASADGVLGLGWSNISFATRATKLYGGRFSYCLVDHLAPRNATSHLTFGPNPSFAAHGVHRTPILFVPRLTPYYAVSVVGISVGGEVLKIPMSVWDETRSGGTIVDSGTSLTVLTEPAYREVVSAISRRLAGLPRVNVDPFEYCYNWTSPAAKEVEVPSMIVHFRGSARLEPPVKSYVIDVEPGVKCIGITSMPWPGTSTIGNILQQEHLWEFDIRSRELRFQRSTCEH